MRIKAVRGATTVKNNTFEEIIEVTKMLLTEIVNRNSINLEDIVSVNFVSTIDINEAFPARAARELGWTQIPLMDSVSPNVKNSLNKCIRIMLLFYTEKTHNEIEHVYLNDAVKLRSDLIK